MTFDTERQRLIAAIIASFLLGLMYGALAA